MWVTIQLLGRIRMQVRVSNISKPLSSMISLYYISYLDIPPCVLCWPMANFSRKSGCGSLPDMVCVSEIHLSLSLAARLLKLRSEFFCPPFGAILCKLVWLFIAACKKKCILTERNVIFVSRNHNQPDFFLFGVGDCDERNF